MMAIRMEHLWVRSRRSRKVSGKCFSSWRSSGTGSALNSDASGLSPSVPICQHSLWLLSSLLGLATATSMTIKKAESEAAQPEKTQKRELPKCGQWCAASPSEDSKCIMDSDIVPCRGEFCTTTCKLWDIFVLGPDDKRRPVSCDMYANGAAFPRGAELCDVKCLIPEIRAERYPAPTGLGIMCRPGTCSPGACPWGNKKGPALGELQCPCNWFGSECDQDWVPVQKVIKGPKYGPLQHITLQIDKQKWKTVIRDYQPGGVIRIVQRDTKDQETPREMACALVSYQTTPGNLEFLLAPPDPSLRPEPRQVAERLWNMTTTKASDTSSSSSSSLVSNLYVNPTISGFFNGRYTYLLDSLRANPDIIQRLVVLSSGAGLGAALAAIDVAIRENKTRREQQHHQPLEVHLYYGLRNLEHLPYRKRLEDLASSGEIRLTFVVSGGPALEEQLQKVGDHEQIRAAVERGETARKLKPALSKKMEDLLSTGPDAYTQDIVGLDLTTKQGHLQKQGASMENTVFIVCGRYEILRDTGTILRAYSDAKELVSDRLFTNI